MRKHFSSLILLLAATLTLWVAAPPPSNAAVPCIPGFEPVCNLFDADLLLKSAVSRLKIGIDSFMMQLKLELGKKNSQAESLNEMAGALASARNGVARIYVPGPTGASCAIASAYSTYMAGGTGNQPPASSITAPPGMGKDAPPPRAPAKQLGPLTDNDGNGRPLSAALKELGPTHKITGKGLADQATIQVERANTDCRENIGSECENQWKYVQQRFIDRQNFYGPDQFNAKFRDADINATTLLSVDTLATDEGNIAMSTGKYPGSTVDQIYPTKTMVDAARDFCRNLVDPTILAPNRGAAKVDLTRQAHGAARAGWNARLSLASTICTEAVTRRIPKDYTENGQPATGDNGGWVTQIMQETRAADCAAGGKATNLECDPDVNGQVSTAYVSKINHYSDFEALRALMTGLLSSKLDAQMAGGSNDSEALKRLLQTDQLAVMMNYRIYQLQERLNLVKAAQLAQQVEGERSDPEATGPQ